MDGWEDDLYDYGAAGDEDAYDAYEDEYHDEDRDRDADERFDGDPDDEIDPFRGEMVEEDIDFKPDFKQMQQMIGDRGKGTTLAPGAGKRAQKAMRSVEDMINDQIRGVLSADVYSSMSESRKNSLVSEAETFKDIHLLHLETFIQALIWKSENKALNKKSFADFIKKYGITDQISLLAYIRKITRK